MAKYGYKSTTTINDQLKIQKKNSKGNVGGAKLPIKLQ